MPEQPEISVLIPAKNAAETIHIAIEDASRQVGVDWQIIIADDSSTDRTREVIGEYQKYIDKIRVIPVPEPGGIVAGRNALLAAADTPYIAWLDADDAWPREDKLIRQIQRLQRYPETALVGDAKVKGVFLENLKQKTFRFPPLPEDIALRLLFKNAFIMSSIVARTEMVRSTPFDPDMEYLEDYVWVQSLSEKYTLRNIPLGGTLHFISTIAQQRDKDNRYQVYAREGDLLFRALQKKGISISSEEALSLAGFVRRNRPLNRKEAHQLKTLIKTVSEQLIEKGTDKQVVNAFFYKIKWRIHKCRFLLRS